MYGAVNENLIAAKLEQKCDIKRDPTYDHKYKLDFIIDRFKSIAKLSHIGVQVTRNPYDSAKQKEFLRERSKKTLLDRSLYVKVHPETDIENYGAELIYNAVVAFAFQKDLRQKDVLGVLINPDVTYEFFELDGYESSAGGATGRQIVGTVNGLITYYDKDKGFGFVVNDEGSQWYFHISEVKDMNLRNIVLPMVEISDETNKLTESIKATFEDAGYTRKNAKFPTAINVKRVLPSEEE